VKLKIGEIARRSGLRASTIRYYVQEGLLPKPEKANEKMAYYDESCVERLRIIQELQEKRYFPLYLIKNILRRMDEGIGLTEAQAVECAVFGSDGLAGALVDRKSFLIATGISDKELREAESIGILIPFMGAPDKPLYNEDDIRIGRDTLKALLDYGLELKELQFFSELGNKIVAREMALRRKIVAGKSTKENIRITAEITGTGDFYREYILRRLFRQQVQENIRKSLKSKKEKAAKLPNTEKNE
jgi:DNA-binding transcriptional MerR regulator